MQNPLPYRYAVYFAPQANSLWNAVWSAWLGRDAYNPLESIDVSCKELPRDLFQAVTSDPRRYGLHATLKAPFRLAAGQRFEALDEALKKIAQDYRPINLGQTRLEVLDDFLAITLENTPQSLNDLERDCVTKLDVFRAPLLEHELAKRRRQKLNDTESHLLDQWGYPYVLGQFKFHMSLTGRLNSLLPGQREILLNCAEREFSKVENKPLVLDQLCVFIEPRQGAPFEILNAYPLNG